MLKIVQTPHPVLASPAKPVAKIDKKVRKIIAEMKTTLLGADKPKGVGLAAPQVGIPLQIFIAKPDEKSEVLVFINPQIMWRSKEKSGITRPEGANKKENNKGKSLEGCLSVRNVWGYLERSSKVRMKYLDIDGQKQEKEFTGFMATIIQHECDHLQGVVFTQRVLEQREKLYRIEKDGRGEESLIELEL